MTISFAELGLPQPVLAAAADMGYKTPTPIQIKAIPEVLKGRDIMGAAQTGTGKTAAFSMPLIAHMLNAPRKRTPKSVRALILAPTRELAAQIDENLRQYCSYTPLTTALVFGGVGLLAQTRLLLQGVDFLVATPGRLLDHIRQGNVFLKEVEFLVLDEADRMLDMGFIHDIRRILTLVPKQRQTLMFSATFSNDIIKLAQTMLRNPEQVEIARNRDNVLITQEAWAVPKNRKRELLRDLIVDNKWSQVLVFTRMKHVANRLAQQLVKDGINAAAIHGNKSQSARTKALSGFKNHTLRVLVATDIAARGLDIEGLPQVVNYELPNVAQDYVHRIGRTGRAGHPGHAVSLVCPDEMQYLRDIERLLKKKIELKKAQGYDGPVPEDIAQDNARLDAQRTKEREKFRQARRKGRQGNPSCAHPMPQKMKTAVKNALFGSTPGKSSRRSGFLDKTQSALSISGKSRSSTPREGNFHRRDSTQEPYALKNDASRKPKGKRLQSFPLKNGFARTHRSNNGNIKSTVVRGDTIVVRHPRTKSKIESVSSNLPPGMVLKFRRR